MGLGQAGFLIKSPGGTLLALDPYLSNSCKAIGDEHGFDMDRLLPPPLDPTELAGVDAYVMTHSHQDHCDPETIAASRTAGGRGPYVAPSETIEKLRALAIPDEELRMIWPNREVVFGDVTVRTTFAIPGGGDDLTHVGYVVTVQGGPKIYFTGDTGWHDLLADAVAPHQPDVMVTVINPAFRNLSPAEAAVLAKQLDVSLVIPCHHDLFASNCQPPQMLRTNLHLLGIGERYLLLQHGDHSILDNPNIPKSHKRQLSHSRGPAPPVNPQRVPVRDGSPLISKFHFEAPVLPISHGYEIQPL